MDYKKIAQETLEIQRLGYYEVNSKIINFSQKQNYSEESSVLLSPSDCSNLVKTISPPARRRNTIYSVENQSTVQAIIHMHQESKEPYVLNFASAKNPGGGFLNGSMAQEEALAILSGLYSSLLLHNDYYLNNRVCGTMTYTDHAIYSPSVVFFRNENFELLDNPVTASVLTIPAVNMGQVVQKKENVDIAKDKMKNRMRICLAIFAAKKASHVILGAYGCGVFRNNPNDVALWWYEILEEEGYSKFFEKVIFAILDSTGKIISPFQFLFSES